MLRELVAQQVNITSFNEMLPTINEIFIEQVEGKNNE
ncbi:MAG: DUF4162 domain-containing protein [Chitinophagales bacterium]|nr:DUF4162 domain-containing protein [Chitinophagales bacterium]